ncbi:response regulator transcription factor [Paenibacillus mesophilus]|uniref:response regulator transcription factor n=1 Tax=Paenibacillus mesophilus TaxID=2582849 RepID=UPI001EE4720A|nr:response regulator [Paenibacillus mesophilus]
MIVDDEVHVVERFSTTIDWTAVGIEQVYGAYSGEKALALLERFSIDIVITDIQMPGMTGLQLIAEVQRRWPRTKCILLSGYSDFNYAKEAILYRTEDYLLKPVTERALVDTVQRVMEKLRKEWEEVVSKQRLAYTLKEHMPTLRGTLLNDLLQGRKLADSALKDKMQMLGLEDVIGKTFAIMMIRLEEYFLRYDPHGISLMEYAIGNMVEELFGDRLESWHTKDAYEYLVFVMVGKNESVGTADDSVWFERTASSLQTAVSNYLKGKISVLVSRWGTFPADLSDLYTRSVAAFRRTIGGEQELFVRLNDDPLRTDVQPLPSLYEPPTLIHLLEAARWDTIEEKLGSLFGELGKVGAESQEQLLEVYFSIASAFAYIVHKSGRSLPVLIGEDYDKMIKGVPFRSLNQLKDWTFGTLNRIRDDMNRETKDSRDSLINDIRAFVEHHMAEDVSLQSIADHVHLHPVYVSKIYKLETGDNLSDYVHRVRMDKAEYLLKHGQSKIYEIAALLGYQRPHSFNHAFKKHFGMTPQEYRDRYS